MSLTKTIEDSEFGEIKLAKYKRAKYLKVKISQDGEVSLSMPYFVAYQDAIDFLEEKRFWLKQELNKLNLKKNQLKLIKPDSVIEIPETKDLDEIRQPISTDYKTKHHELELIPCDLGQATYRISTNKIKIYYPKSLSSKDKEVSSVIEEALTLTLRKEAKNYIPRRLKELALKHGLKYGTLTLRDTKTRWGSCTHDNNINICIHVMKLPDDLIDYILLHELAHTIEKNHSQAFWDLVSSYLGQDARKIDAQLKNFTTEIILL